MTARRRPDAFVPQSGARHDNSATGMVRIEDVPTGPPPTPSAPPRASAPPPRAAPPAPPGAAVPHGPVGGASGAVQRLTQAEFDMRFHREGNPLYATTETEAFVAMDAGVAEGVQATVVVKHFKAQPGGQDRQWRRRLGREAQALAMATHSALPTLRGAFETDNGGFLVTELFAVDTLQSYVAARGKLRQGAAFQILGDVAGALEALHASGGVHRDVRPGNIVIRPAPDGTWNAQLIDLDNVWLHELEPHPAALRAHMGEVLPPEAVERDEWSRGSDAFLWGHALAYALTGSPELTVLTRGKSPVAEFVRRLTAAQSGQRPPSMRAIRAELTRLAGPTTAEVAPPTKSRVWVLVAGVGLAAVFTAVIVYQSVRTPPAPTGPAVIVHTPRTGADAPPLPTPPTTAELPAGFPDRLKLAEQRVELSLTLNPRYKGARIESLEREALTLITEALGGHFPTDDATERVVGAIRGEAWYAPARKARLVELQQAMARGDAAGMRKALDELYLLDPTDPGLAFARRNRQGTQVTWEER